MFCWANDFSQSSVLPFNKTDMSSPEETLGPIQEFVQHRMSSTFVPPLWGREWVTAQPGVVHYSLLPTCCFFSPLQQNAEMLPHQRSSKPSICWHWNVNSPKKRKPKAERINENVFWKCEISRTEGVHQYNTGLGWSGCDGHDIDRKNIKQAAGSFSKY